MKVSTTWYGRKHEGEDLPLTKPDGGNLSILTVELTNGHRFEVSESVDGTGLKVCAVLGHFTVSVYSRREIILRAGL